MNATPPTGEQRKQAAHLLLEARRENYLRKSRRVLLSRLLANNTATIDDVRAEVELPDGVTPKCFGAVPGQLVRAGLIRRFGFCRTTRPVAHARPVTVWQLVDAPRAQAWLSSHGPLPELTTAAQLALPFGNSRTASNETGDAANVARSADY